MISKLESVGFLSFFTRRIGPCHRCTQTILTYYLPEEKIWMCEGCYYSNDDNKMFISIVNSLGIENTMATTNIQELMARLDRLEAENRQLKAKSSDNVFVGGTDNLTLKNRQLSQRGWAVPTKNQQGQGFLRCGDFPMSYFLSEDGKKVVLHTEISVAPHEAQLFKERFLMQGIVVAKRRTDGTPSAPSTPTASTPATPSVSPSASTSTSKSWSTMTDAEKAPVIAEAQGLVSTGLFTDLGTALGSVLHGRNISK